MASEVILLSVRVVQGRVVLGQRYEVDTGLEDVNLRLRAGTSRAFCVSWVLFHGRGVDTGLEDIYLRLRDGTSRASVQSRPYRRGTRWYSDSITGAWSSRAVFAVAW